MEDRYSVVIRLVDQVSSDGFYCFYNGKRFQQTQVPAKTVLVVMFSCFLLFDFDCLHF